MGWISKKKLNNLIDSAVEEKLNPAQSIIALGEGTSVSRENTVNYRKQYEEIEIVNRSVNMVVDDASEIPAKVGDKVDGITPIKKNVRKATLERLLNAEPNPFQDISTFKRNLLVDFIVDGNIFMYFDGVHLYHLPASKMTIHPDPENYVESYEFEGRITYLPEEIIHIKENSFYSIYRGISRLRAAKRTMELLSSMRKFQDNFFKNGAVPGLVIKSPNTLSEKIKTRLLESWMIRYNPSSGGRRPLFLDGGLELDSISNTNFKELDFQASIKTNEETILKAIGVPPILLNGGNNANIRPNHRLYYLETILPIVRKINFALTRFFGFKITENVTDIPALQPELKEQAAFYTTLTNGGLFTPNESRAELGKASIDGHDDLRIPANIAGSAANPSEGGRPQGEEE